MSDQLCWNCGKKKKNLHHCDDDNIRCDSCCMRVDGAHVSLPPKPLDPRHAHLALMAAVLIKPIPPSHEREWAIRDRLELAREILAEVEAQEREGAK